MKMKKNKSMDFSMLFKNRQSLSVKNEFLETELLNSIQSYKNSYYI